MYLFNLLDSLGHSRAFHLLLRLLCVCFAPRLPSSGPNPNITLQPRLGAPSLSKPRQSKMSLSLSLLFYPPEPKSNISTGTCKRNCPCGKMSKPPIVAPLWPLPRDTTTLSVSHIYLGVQIFPLLCCVTSLEQLTVENDSVLRKGEYQKNVEHY